MSTTVYHALEQIANTPGTNDKLALLKTHVDSEAFQRVLIYMLNPFITFGIRPARASQFGAEEFSQETWSMLDQLAARGLTGHRAEEAVTRALTSLNPESSELLWRILSRTRAPASAKPASTKSVPGLFLSSATCAAASLTTPIFRSGTGLLVSTRRSKPTACSST